MPFGLRAGSFREEGALRVTLGFACNQGFVFSLFYLGQNRALGVGPFALERADLLGALSCMLLAFALLRAASPRARDARLARPLLWCYAGLLVLGSLMPSLAGAEAAVGAIVDSVLLMTYEWGYAYGTPMAVAPLPQVREVAEYAVTEIPPWKLQLGIPNYGYDWTLPHAAHRRARVVGNQEAVTLAARTGAVIQYDGQAQAPTFRYRQDGWDHQVWFEDARSIGAKLRLARELDLAGVGYWSLMRPFAQNWALMSQLVRVRRGEGTL